MAIRTYRCDVCNRTQQRHHNASRCLYAGCPGRLIKLDHPEHREAEVQRLRERLTLLESQADTLRTTHLRLRKRLTLLESRVDTLRTIHVRLSAALKDIEADNRQCHADIASVREQLQRLD